MYNYCTLFDSNYINKGLALYQSLCNVCNDFHLYVVAFDDNCYNILKKLNFEYLTVISLTEFENEELLAIKPTRNRAEYCWTAGPTMILHFITVYNLEHCTYLDADMMFYASPDPIYDEIGSSSIALTEHFYTKKYDQSSTSGRYCVQFVFFKNDTEGLKALNWWKDSCINWCYSRLEKGKFGDQKYLDDWTERFNNVHVIKNRGAGLAPWNIQQYEIINPDNFSFKISNNTLNENFKMIFFHFHNLRFIIDTETIIVAPSKFDLSVNVKNLIYVPYINDLIRIDDSLNNNYHYSNYKYVFKEYLVFIKYLLPVRMLLKKVELFRAINRFFVRSSRK